MSKLILLRVLINIDEDAKVMLSWCHLDTSSGEFGRYLIEATSRQALFWAVDVEG